MICKNFKKGKFEPCEIKSPSRGEINKQINQLEEDMNYKLNSNERIIIIEFIQANPTYILFADKSGIRYNIPV